MQSKSSRRAWLELKKLLQLFLESAHHCSSSGVIRVQDQAVSLMDSLRWYIIARAWEITPLKRIISVQANSFAGWELLKLFLWAFKAFSVSFCDFIFCWIEIQGTNSLSFQVSLDRSHYIRLHDWITKRSKLMISFTSKSLSFPTSIQCLLNHNQLEFQIDFVECAISQFE